MRVTPLEIRQKSFEKHFRGYDKDEVNAFLLTLSQEWEKILDENKELRIKLDSTEKEVMKLREVETSLYKTLKTAEDTGANVIEQARTAADLHLKESQMRAEALINEAKLKAKDTIDESEERAKQIIEDMEDRVKLLVEKYKNLESSRETLLSDLKRLAGETLDRVERALNNSADFDPDKHFNTVKRETKNAIFPNGNYHKKTVTEEAPVPIKEEMIHEPVAVEAPVKKTPKSFFDDIE